MFPSQLEELLYFCCTQTVCKTETELSESEGKVDEGKVDRVRSKGKGKEDGGVKGNGEVDGGVVRVRVR